MLLLLLMLGTAHADAPWAERVARIDTQLMARPGDPGLLMSRAPPRRRAGQLDDAMASLQDVDTPAASLERARIEAARGSAEAALPHLQGLDGAAAHTLRGDLLVTTSPDDAIAAWDAALQTRPDPDLHLRRARLAHRQGRSDTLDVLGRGVRTLSGAVVLRLERAHLAMDLDEPMVAFLEATALLGQDPGRPDWLLLQADALDALGRDGSAHRVAALTTARQRLARRATALNRLGLALALLANDRADEARALAIDLDPDLPGVRALLAATESP